MTPADKITADELRAERMWLIQHGVREYCTTGGLSMTAAVRRVEREVEDINREIAALTDAIAKATTP